MRPYFYTLGTIIVFSLLACKTSDVKREEFRVKEQNCMEKVMAQDSSMGEVRNHASETMSLSDAISNYAASMDNYDFKDCPKAFKDAFKDHQQAWRELIAVTDHYPDQRGELHEIFKIIEAGAHAEAFATGLKGILDTWAEVEKAME